MEVSEAIPTFPKNYTMILLTKFKGGVMAFLEIGDEFTLIDKETSKSDFELACINHFGKDDTHFTPETIGFVCYNSGSGLRPLYKNQENVLMSNTGKVFRQISGA